jgi:hypothetical protein
MTDVRPLAVGVHDISERERGICQPCVYYTELAREQGYTPFKCTTTLRRRPHDVEGDAVCDPCYDRLTRHNDNTFSAAACQDEVNSRIRFEEKDRARRRRDNEKKRRETKKRRAQQGQ